PHALQRAVEPERTTGTAWQAPARSRLRRKPGRQAQRRPRTESIAGHRAGAGERAARSGHESLRRPDHVGGAVSPPYFARAVAAALPAFPQRSRNQRDVGRVELPFVASQSETGFRQRLHAVGLLFVLETD